MRFPMFPVKVVPHVQIPTDPHLLAKQLVDAHAGVGGSQVNTYRRVSPNGMIWNSWLGLLDKLGENQPTIDGSLYMFSLLNAIKLTY